MVEVCERELLHETRVVVCDPDSGAGYDLELKSCDAGKTEEFCQGVVAASETVQGRYNAGVDRSGEWEELWRGQC